MYLHNEDGLHGENASPNTRFLQRQFEGFVKSK
jgi:hypothetical protein